MSLFDRGPTSIANRLRASGDGLRCRPGRDCRCRSYRPRTRRITSGGCGNRRTERCRCGVDARCMRQHRNTWRCAVRGHRARRVGVERRVPAVRRTCVSPHRSTVKLVDYRLTMPLPALARGPPPDPNAASQVDKPVICPRDPTRATFVASASTVDAEQRRSDSCATASLGRRSIADPEPVRIADRDRREVDIVAHAALDPAALAVFVDSRWRCRPSSVGVPLGPVAAERRVIRPAGTSHHARWLGHVLGQLAPARHGPSRQDPPHTTPRTQPWCRNIASLIPPIDRSSTGGEVGL